MLHRKATDMTVSTRLSNISVRKENLISNLLHRDDPEPAPCTKAGKKNTEEKQLKCKYPENYVPKEPKAKGKKRKRDETDDKENTNCTDNGPEQKKMKYMLPMHLKKLINTDEHNEKIWTEAKVKNWEGHQAVLDYVDDIFQCSICLCLLDEPMKLQCQHNMC